MSGPLLNFDTSSYEKHEISSFIYEPVFGENGKVSDFCVRYASRMFAKHWSAVCRNKDHIGAMLRESGFLDDYSLSMMERFVTEEPVPFMTYMPMLDLHLYFEPIHGLPEPYAGFYLTNITNYASYDAKDHFLQNIRQMKNNAVLLRLNADGLVEPDYVSEEFAAMMECSVTQAQDMMRGFGFYKTTDPEDRPLVRSMMKHHVAYDGGSVLTIQKMTAKNNRIWCNVHYAFINDFGERYIYCTYTDVTSLKAHEDRLRNTYAEMGADFYKNNGNALTNLRVDLTKNAIEEVKGSDNFDTDSIAIAYSDALVQRASYLPIQSERERFLQLFDRSKLINDYLAGKPETSLVMYSRRRDGHYCFVRMSAAVTRHPLNGNTVAFLTEQECNSDKVKDTLTDKILAKQFDMVAYLVDGRYGVTIGEAAKVRHGSIFPTTNNGNYEWYIENQVKPVLYGSEEEKANMLEMLSLANIERELSVNEPYVVDIAVEMGGETYYKQFDFYSVDPGAKFYILLKSDTTEIQKQHLAMNEHLKTALEAANQANIAKTAFLSSMSHEIRTPMNAIIGLDNIALSDPDLPETTRGYLEKIGGSAGHLLGLINDILDMSRIESGKMNIRSEEFSFSGMLEQINTMINGQCADKGLTYECRVEGRVDDFYIGDDMKLKQVIINILGNAVKFTPAPGKVSFIIESGAQFEGQTAMKFVMSDTGIGMDKAYIPKIFDAFSQEDSSRANKYGSTGLGMAITRNIVELMNGSIGVESEKGKGTTFTVTVPLRVSRRKENITAGIEPHSLKVLVVDDDPVDREHARLVLEEMGISADICESGEEALDAVRLRNARGEVYDLIFVDWKMPGRDGIAVTRDIRQVTGGDSAVIVLTAYSWEDIEEEAKRAGVDTFMAKPLFSSNVMRVFEKIVSDRRDAVKLRPPTDLRGRKLLIAEDIAINAAILKKILSLKEITADHAENGQAAVEMFAASAPGSYDAILMDVRMPVLDGLGATEKIRALNRPDAKTVPIIAMTANAFDEDVQQSLQAGMNAHLTKPVEKDRLFATLSGLIQ